MFIYFFRKQAFKKFGKGVKRVFCNNVGNFLFNQKEDIYYGKIN